MNNEIKTLLSIYERKPPHTVQTDEEVVEWLLEELKERDNTISFVRGVLTPFELAAYSPNEEMIYERT